MSKVKLSDYKNSILELISNGLKPVEIARELNLNKVSVNSWIHANVHDI